MKWIYGINFDAIHKKMLLSESRYRETFAIRIGGKSAILNLIKLNFCMVHPYLKLHILFDNNGPDI